MSWEVSAIMSSGRVVDLADRIPSISVDLVGITERCYRCGKQGVAIAGVIVDPTVARALVGVEDDLFLDFEPVGEALREAVDPVWLASHFTGPLKVPRSRPRPEGYMSNGCHSCDAIIGTSPLREAVEKISMARLREFAIGSALVSLDALREAVNGVKLEWS